MPWVATTRFSILGFAPEGSVSCSYALGGPAFSPAGFTAWAICDEDGDGEPALSTVTHLTHEIARSGDDY